MIVFIDSTEFLKDPFAKKMSWDRLKDWRECDWARIIVPQIVIEDAAKQYRTSLEEVGRKLNRNLHRIGTLLPKGNWSLPPILIDGAEELYREALSKRLGCLHIEQPDHVGRVLLAYPARSTKASIVGQLISSCLTDQDTTAVIITGTSRDFGIPSKLEPEFRAYLEKGGIGLERIQIFRSLFDFVKAHVQPRLRKRDDVIEAIEKGTFPLDSDQLFADRYDEVFAFLSESIEPWGELQDHFNTPEFGSPQLAELSTVPEHFQIDTLDMDGNQFVLFVRYWVDGIVSCKLKHTDSIGYHTGRVSFEIQASMLVDMETGEADDFEIGGDYSFTLWSEDWNSGRRPDENECA